jgi:ABC-type uncharacterized transport system permease subunit
VASLLMADPAKAFDFAADTTKQLITLPTAILALTITFLKDVAGEISGWAEAILAIAWGCYVLSVVAGVLTLMAPTGNLERPQAGATSIYAGNIKTFALAQIGLFFLAIALTVTFGVISL